MSDFKIFTDGSSTGERSCDGGYAFVLLTSDELPLLVIRGSLSETTNNVMELEAIRQAIILVTGFDDDSYSNLAICTDSMYSLNSITKWSRGWASRGWLTSEGKPVANKELMRDISSHWRLARKDKIEIVKVKAHSGDYWNEVVDRLAKGARAGVCGECSTKRSSSCKICKITRSAEWLSENVPSLNYLIRMSR